MTDSFLMYNSKKVSMKKILNLTFLVMVCFVISSCSDDEVVSQVPLVRDYQTDARILAKFVDINKTLGEYYINENKKNSPMAYVIDKDKEELQLVNPVNRTRYENELKTLNSQLEAAANRSDVSQIVYNVYGETWIRNINNEDTPFKIEKANTLSTRTSRASHGRFNLLYNNEQRHSFYAGKQITSTVRINMMGYNYYFFEVVCTIDASKSPNGTIGGDKPKSILMSGSAIIETYDFVWTAASSSTQIFWEFKGRQYAPQNISEGSITLEFYD